ncbi:MAG: hypothetical protein EAZ81_02745 [Verrucomicrobia bacterium]|jgi:hypothetical protein|nr:MAG: hypothetical protein EAZ81_02745 [Verrucomicrobiota bacterium]
MKENERITRDELGYAYGSPPVTFTWMFSMLFLLLFGLYILSLILGVVNRFLVWFFDACGLL